VIRFDPISENISYFGNSDEDTIGRYAFDLAVHWEMTDTLMLSMIMGK